MSSGPAERFAVVDIGSNTVKMTVYACDGEHGIVPLTHDADTVRIGFRVAETGAIADDRRDRLLATLARFESAARACGALSFTGVATQAFRVAVNAAEVIDRIHEATAWRVRVIDTGEETRLTVEAARPWFVSHQTNLVADIGGASTELIAARADGSVAAAGSVPLGSGVLYDRDIGASPPPAGSLEQARDHAVNAIAVANITDAPASSLLLAGGTGQFLTLLLRSLAPETPFTPDALPLLRGWLAHRHALETVERIPIQLDRAQVLPASLAVVEALVLRHAPQMIIAIPSGIRDGIAREICGPADPHS